MRWNYDWNLKDTLFSKTRGSVFSCFACGGGSTLGYKLAGYDVIGMNEIDPRLAETYILNHKPRFPFVMDIRKMVALPTLPTELYHLDILDGSPPCSSFSMAGVRDRDWGTEKKFAEGQALQVLDTLFFDFIALAKRLQPKVVLAENVSGLLVGKAQAYVLRILQAFREAGYDVTYRSINTQDVGVPQSRQRVVFCAVRKDLGIRQVGWIGEPALNLKSSMAPIPFSAVYTPGSDDWPMPRDTKLYSLWQQREPSDADFSAIHHRVYGKKSFYTNRLLRPTRCCPTLTPHPNSLILHTEYRRPNLIELCKIGAWPCDYNFGASDPRYLLGMSVPPLLAAHVADRVGDQWLDSRFEGQVDVKVDIDDDD